jgi:hypothetical protein
VNPPLTRVTGVELQRLPEGDVAVYLRGEVAGAGSELRWDSDHATAKAAAVRVLSLVFLYNLPDAAITKCPDAATCDDPSCPFMHDRATDDAASAPTLF